MTYRGRAATKMTCGFSVSPGKTPSLVSRLPCLQAASARFSGPSRHPGPLGHPFCPGPTCPHPFRVPAQWGCCPAPPQPHEHHALLPRQVRCPRPRCPQAASTVSSAAARCVVCPICRGLQHYLWEHRIPYKDFAAHSLEVTATSSCNPARRSTRSRDPILNSPDTICTLFGTSPPTGPPRKAASASSAPPDPPTSDTTRTSPTLRVLTPTVHYQPILPILNRMNTRSSDFATANGILPRPGLVVSHFRAHVGHEHLPPGTVHAVAR